MQSGVVEIHIPEDDVRGPHVHDFRGFAFGFTATLFCVVLDVSEAGNNEDRYYLAVNVPFDARSSEANAVINVIEDANM